MVTNRRRTQRASKVFLTYVDKIEYNFKNLKVPHEYIKTHRIIRHSCFSQNISDSFTQPTPVDKFYNRYVYKMDLS